MARAQNNLEDSRPLSHGRSLDRTQSVTLSLEGFKQSDVTIIVLQKDPSGCAVWLMRGGQRNQGVIQGTDGGALAQGPAGTHMGICLHNILRKESCCVGHT